MPARKFTESFLPRPASPAFPRLGARYEFRNLNGHWLTKTFRKEAAKAVFPCLAAVLTLFQPAARRGGDSFCRPLVPNMAKEACVTKDSIGWRLELED
jgi:hypothetical protein